MTYKYALGSRELETLIAARKIISRSIGNCSTGTNDYVRRSECYSYLSRIIAELEDGEKK